MQARHAIASCYLGVSRKLSMLERFYWWIDMSVCMRWWLHRCLQCQAHTSSRQTVRWPILSLPLPSGPGVAVSVDYFGPLPATPREFPSFYSQHVGSGVAQTCTLSLRRSSRLKAPPTSWPTSTYLFGVVRPAFSPIMGCNSAPSWNLLCTIF